MLLIKIPKKARTRAASIGGVPTAIAAMHCLRLSMIFSTSPKSKRVGWNWRASCLSYAFALNPHLTSWRRVHRKRDSISHASSKTMCHPRSSVTWRAAPDLSQFTHKRSEIHRTWRSRFISGRRKNLLSTIKFYSSWNFSLNLFTNSVAILPKAVVSDISERNW